MIRHQQRNSGACDFPQPLNPVHLTSGTLAASLPPRLDATFGIASGYVRNPTLYLRGTASKRLSRVSARLNLKPGARGPIPLVLAVLLLLTLLLSCKGSNEQLGVSATPRAERQQCAGLEDRLQRMIGASDPAQFAQEQSIYYRDGLVRVTIELASADAQLPSGYGLQIEGRTKALVQALVPLQELCRLSNEPQIRSVMVPSVDRPLRG